MCGAYDGWTCSIKVDEKFSIQEWEDFTLKFKPAKKERERDSPLYVELLVVIEVVLLWGSLVTK
jgi:hypothetical protein